MPGSIAPGQGAIIAELRRNRGLTQEELAERTGMSARSIGQLERGLISRPRRATADALAEAFGLSGAARERFVAQLRGVRDADSPPAFGQPAQLPPADTGFVGRRAERAQLDEWLLEPDGAGGPVVIEGDAGLGKTGLAVQWAYSARENFPDGQLFARLHGFSAGSPAEPADILQDFLVALGVPAGELPTGLDARSALMRTLVAARRMVIVLDDALDADQVTPLLPGAGSCATLITSRRRMVALAARQGCRRMELGTLTTDEAQEMLLTQLGMQPGRTGLDRVVDAGGGMPLALRILAGQAHDRGWGHMLNVVDTRPRLDAVSIGAESAASVRQVMSTSVDNLGPDAGELFRAFGLVTTPDVSRYALAALLGWPTPRMELATDELVAVHLIAPRDNRLTIHDLVQEFAKERAADWPEPQRSSAQDRLACLLIDLAEIATRDIRGQQDTKPVLPRLTPRDVELPDRPEQWLAEELVHLRAAIHWICGGGDDVLIGRLADALWMLEYRHLWQVDADLLYTAAIAAAGRTGDLAAQSRPLRYLGLLQARRGELESADHLLTRALELAERTDDPAEQADANSALAEAHFRASQFRTALAGFSRSYRLRTTVGIEFAQTSMLCNIGVCHLKLAEYDEAAPVFAEALAAAERARDHDLQGWVLSHLSAVHRYRGDPEVARELAAQALAVTEDSPDRQGRAVIAVQLADVAVELGQLDLAERMVDEVEAAGTLSAVIQVQNALDNTKAELAAARGDRSTAQRLFDSVVLHAGGRNPEEWARAQLGLARLAAGNGVASAVSGHIAAARQGYDLLSPQQQAALDELARGRPVAESSAGG